MNSEEIRKTAATLAIIAVLGVGACVQGKDKSNLNGVQTYYGIEKNNNNNNTVYYDVEKLSDDNNMYGDYHIREILSYEPLEKNDYFIKIINGEYFIYKLKNNNKVLIYNQVNVISNDVDMMKKNFEKIDVNDNEYNILISVLNENKSLTLK